MAGVGGLSSLGLFLLLLLASFSAAREERSMRADQWKLAAEADITFLALLQYEGTRRAAAYCSGTIISKSCVLTYCPKDPTMAYAGKLKITEEGSNEQERAVLSVANFSAVLNNLKICKVEDWDLNEHVNTAKLNNGARGLPMTGCTLLGFGGDGVAARKMEQQTIGAYTVCSYKTAPPPGCFYSKVETGKTQDLKPNDLGGPAVCGKVQRGINMKHDPQSTETGQEHDACNHYIDIAEYSTWIEEQKNAAESGAAGGTGGNGTSPSSGYSIHSYLNKYSNWKVLGFLVPTIVTFLQY